MWFFFTVLQMWVKFFFSSCLQAYRWCIEAMKEITPGLPVKVVVDVLRQASKVTLTTWFYNLGPVDSEIQKSFEEINLWFVTFSPAAGLRGEARVQESWAADQTCSVSSKVACCVFMRTHYCFCFFACHESWFSVFFFSCREHFGHKHPKYSDTLLDYGFYLLNVDNICQSVAIYQVGREAADIQFFTGNLF